MRTRALLLVLIAGFASGHVMADPRDGGRELIGQRAPAWQAEHWINAAPLALSQLRGKVVLVRWWAAPDCPFCAQTAPALNGFHARYAARGLTVVGMYHHKARDPLQPADVERYSKQFGFRFPVAIDPRWATLKTWWLDHSRRAFTSVSFLIDRQGVIRHVHPGGKYEHGDAAFAAMEAMIEQLLGEPGQAL